MKVKFLTLVTTITLQTACSHAPNPMDATLTSVVKQADTALPKLEEEEEENLDTPVSCQLNNELESMRAELLSELRSMIRREIIPEIWSKQSIPEAVARTQRSVRKNAKAMPFVGRVEWIRIREPEISFQARIDTGAQTSSMHAVAIEEKKVKGELYVQFETEDQNAKKQTLLRRVVATTTIKKSNGKSENRYVIRETIQIGSQTHEVNINLNDRSRLSYKFLIGRNLLLGNYLIDVSKSHLLGDRLSTSTNL